MSTDDKNSGDEPAGEQPDSRPDSRPQNRPSNRKAFAALAGWLARTITGARKTAGETARKTNAQLKKSASATARDLKKMKQGFRAWGPKRKLAPQGGADAGAETPGKKLSPNLSSGAARAMAKAKAASGPKRAAKNWRASALPLLGRAGLTLTSLIFVAGIGGLWVLFIVMAPRVPENADLWDVNRQTALVVLDRHGEEVASRGARYGEAVSTEALPPYLLKAFLATEDRRFYDHRGVDLKGTMRAAFTNMKSGGVVQGGSTITQQLAKNLFLSPEQTYTRKIKEALLAFWLEGRYSKDELLSLYLNRIYLGAGAYGIESAAQTYFDKHASEVTLAEAVMLAGLPKAPSSLAPTNNPFGAEKRAAEVLDNLLEIGEVTPFEAREARQNPFKLVAQSENSELGYFYDYVTQKAATLVGPHAGDLIITTTIDPKLQHEAAIAVAKALSVDARVSGADQAALVSYDINGALRAMVGGRSYLESQFNRATQAKRQPGSAFKPFVYAAAMEAGLRPTSRFIDQPVDIDGWSPTNYGDKYAGPMRLSEALAKSVNTIAVQVSERVGRQKVANMAKRLGFQSDVAPHASIALGAMNVTLEELTGAYLPFARHGASVAPYAIERIEDRDGNLLYQHTADRPTELLSPRAATDMNHLLYQVMHSGTGRRASLGGRASAGKTGTTNDWRDAWFVGYTGQMATGVWVGNDAYQPMKKITGGTIPASIWHDFMLAAHQGLPRKKLDGAYPAVTYGSETELLRYYNDVARGLRDVKADGRRRGRRFRN